MKSRTEQSAQFAVCTDNAGYAASLEVGKLYPVIADEQAAGHGYIRVVDESGEDYGYAAKRFFMLSVPDALAKVLRLRSRLAARTRRATQRAAPTRQRAKAAR
jgi:hypothetical protein